jgi:hypothetical protein
VEVNRDSGSEAVRNEMEQQKSARREQELDKEEKEQEEKWSNRKKTRVSR